VIGGAALSGGVGKKQVVVAVLIALAVSVQGLRRTSGRSS
jgi:hypothetical protein